MTAAVLGDDWKGGQSVLPVGCECWQSTVHVLQNNRHGQTERNIVRKEAPPTLAHVLHPPKSNSVIFEHVRIQFALSRNRKSGVVQHFSSVNEVLLVYRSILLTFLTNLELTLSNSDTFSHGYRWILPSVLDLNMKIEKRISRERAYASWMSVVCTEHGIRQPIGEIATDCETSWTKCNYERDITLPFSPPPRLSLAQTPAVFVSVCVIDRKFAMYRYTSKRECAHTVLYVMRPIIWRI